MWKVEHNLQLILKYRGIDQISTERAKLIISANIPHVKQTFYFNPVLYSQHKFFIVQFSNFSFKNNTFVFDPWCSVHKMDSRPDRLHSAENYIYDPTYHLHESLDAKSSENCFISLRQEFQDVEFQEDDLKNVESIIESGFQDTLNHYNLLKFTNWNIHHEAKKQAEENYKTSANFFQKAVEAMCIYGRFEPIDPFSKSAVYSFN
jgi:hypothetical protein